MRFNERRRLDTGQVSDQRGRGGLPVGGRGMAMGGGGLGLVGLLIVVALQMCSSGGGGGLNIPGLQLPGVSGGAPQVAPQNPNDVQVQAGGQDDLAANCQTGADANQREDCRIVGVVNSVQAYWADDLARRGQQYREATTVLFSGGVDTACGAGSSAMGPFYCPADQTVYLDLTFFEEFRTKFEYEGGPFAQAYVIAHEYGHHLQNLLGISQKVQQSGERQGAESAAVRLELQADCLAGVWANNATAGPDPLILELTDQDIRDGLEAARKVGDDYIQENLGGGRVNSETWTHGSSEQREKWFTTGYRSGEITDCDTFNQDI